MAPSSDAVFVFSTKDRPEYTVRSIRSIDLHGGFDLIWIDGSAGEEGRCLPESVSLSNARVVELHRDIGGGPDAAIRLGLDRALRLGYRYCGLIENDTLLEPGWYPRLMELFDEARREGLNPGAVTVKTIASRVLRYRGRYAELWNIGASMELFTREAAEIVVDTYGLTSARKVADYYADTAGVDLSQCWELWQDEPDRTLGTDWAHCMELHRRGYASVGSVPAMMEKLDMDLWAACRTGFVREPVW